MQGGDERITAEQVPSIIPPSAVVMDGKSVYFLY
jgi:hypothetical protein